MRVGGSMISRSHVRADENSTISETGNGRNGSERRHVGDGVGRMFTKSEQLYDAIYAWKDYKGEATRLMEIIASQKNSRGE
jgi:hypothetical protein